MTTRDEYRAQAREDRVQRLSQALDDLATAIQGKTDDALSRRPDTKNWAAKEVVCHLRDIEELFMLRFHMMLGTDDPPFLTLGDMPPDPQRWGIGGRIAIPLDPARWAEDRQYLRNDTVLALSALRRRREESLIFLRNLTPTQWERGSIHLIDGRMTFDDWTALIAEHDEEHLDQLKRALEGRP
ncbi:MAG TPA: DinB family protein [Methylomirabilota bacterium]|nr:DinB family protein [Methylomirabilota bacterium]